MYFAVPLKFRSIKTFKTINLFSNKKKFCFIHLLVSFATCKQIHIIRFLWTLLQILEKALFRFEGFHLLLEHKPKANGTTRSMDYKALPANKVVKAPRRCSAEPQLYHGRTSLRAHFANAEELDRYFLIKKNDV